MDLVNIVGNAAFICTVASSLSALPVVIEFFRKGSTSSVPPLPFITAATNVSFWLQYSLLTGVRMLQTVNCLMLFAYCCYITCYYINTEHKRKVKKLLFIALAVQLIAATHAFYIANESDAKQVAGLLAAGGTVLSSASPLATVAQVIQSRSSDSLPLPMIFSGFIVSSLWYFYGVLVADTFIQVPNFIGAVLSAIQLTLIAIFPAKKSMESKKD